MTTLLKVRCLCTCIYLILTATSALATIFVLCCNRHPGQSLQVHVEDFFPNKLLYQDPNGKVFYGKRNNPDCLELIAPKSLKKRKFPGANRPVHNRKPLMLRLVLWQRRTCAKHGPLETSDLILSNKNLISLATVNPKEVSSLSGVVNVLGETEEWAGQHGELVFKVIALYKADLHQVSPC